MTLLIIFAALIGLIIVIGMLCVGSYNNFVHLKALVDEALSGIDTQLKRRYDLIPNLVAVVKQYASHEKGVFEQVAQLRSVGLHAQTIDEKAQATNQLSSTLKTLFAVAENYPELKANENFMSLQKELSSLETEINLARRYYNGTARNYNIAISRFPAIIIAGTTGFEKVSYFQAPAEERENPRVNFQ